MSLLVATLTALTLAPTATATADPGPATVTVTVEGGAQTLIASRNVTTTATPVQRGGTLCSGTSAGGALDVASEGLWAASGGEAEDLMVDAIGGEPHPTVGDARTWVLVVNSVVVRRSPCALELNAGDTVLYYVSTLPAVAISPSCRTTGRDGLCGSADRTGPVAVITSIKEQQVFSVARAPLTLSGRIAADVAGLQDVRLRITRIRGRRCHFYSGIEETFLRSVACGHRRSQFFSIGSSARWSYLLPRRLTPGRYTLDVQAVDVVGNISPEGVRGHDRVVFFVR